MRCGRSGVTGGTRCWTRADNAPDESADSNPSWCDRVVRIGREITPNTGVPQQLKRAQTAELLRAVFVLNGYPRTVLRIVASHPIDLFVELIEVELPAFPASFDLADQMGVIFIRSYIHQIFEELFRGGGALLPEMTLEWYLVVYRHSRSGRTRARAGPAGKGAPDGRVAGGKGESVSRKSVGESSEEALACLLL